MGIKVKNNNTVFNSTIVLFFLSLIIFIYGSCSEQASDSQPGASDISNDDEYYTPVDFFRQCVDGDCDFQADDNSSIRYGVPTWHVNDSGFEVEGNPGVISVVDIYAAHPDVPVKCYSIQILGRWDEDIRLFFEVDSEYGVFGMSAAERDHADSIIDDAVEGVFHFSKPLAGSDWRLVKLEIQTLQHRGKMTFSLRKMGVGDALFYFVEVDGQNECTAEAILVDVL